MFHRLEIANVKFRKLMAADAKADTMEREVERISLLVSILSNCLSSDFSHSYHIQGERAGTCRAGKPGNCC